MSRTTHAELTRALLEAFETHSVSGIRSVLDAGYDVRTVIDGKPAVTHLTEMYLRSDRFADCLRLMLDRGVVLDDPVLAPALLDDGDALRRAIVAEPALLTYRASITCTFTPLVGATLLHVAAEYGQIDAARTLIEMGAEVDARAALDAQGMNGQTPLFHTVNSHANRSAPVMRLLLDAGARTDILLPGIVWGTGFPWETTCFDVTPVSYAQLGLLRQMQRAEADCYANIRVLLSAAARPIPPLGNVPNRYLTS